MVDAVFLFFFFCLSKGIWASLSEADLWVLVYTIHVFTVAFHASSHRGWAG